VEIVSRIKNPKLGNASTCSKEVAGLGQVASNRIPRRLQYMVVNELHAGENKVDCGALTRRAPVTAQARLILAPVYEENMD
jgi:hypothetical protein